MSTSEAFTQKRVAACRGTEQAVGRGGDGGTHSHASQGLGERVSSVRGVQDGQRGRGEAAGHAGERQLAGLDGEKEHTPSFRRR